VPFDGSLEDLGASLEAPPDLLDSLDEELLDSVGVAAFSVAALEASVELGLAAVELVLLAFVEVVAVCFAAACSALVSLGGVISGVLLGSVSDTLLPPHAPTPTLATSAMQIASA